MLAMAIPDGFAGPWGVAYPGTCDMTISFSKDDGYPIEPPKSDFPNRRNDHNSSKLPANGIATPENRFLTTTLEDQIEWSLEIRARSVNFIGNWRRPGEAVSR
jgi:hypothetical protein